MRLEIVIRKHGDDGHFKELKTFEKKGEKKNDMTDAKYYEKLINGLVPARTGFDKAIQANTKKDAGLVLAMIGVDHPATKVVYKYLVQQKLDQYGDRGGYLLQRRRKLVYQENPYHALCKKMEREIKNGRGPFPAE